MKDKTRLRGGEKVLECNYQVESNEVELHPIQVIVIMKIFVLFQKKKFN